MRVRRATPHLQHFLAGDLTPLALYRRLRATSPTRFLLESVSGGEQVSRFSILAAQPVEIYRLYRDRLEIENDGSVQVVNESPLQAFNEFLGSIRSAESALPFTGGFVGFFGYDLARMVEDLGPAPPDPYGLPVAQLARYDTALVFDHARQRLTALSNEIEGLVSENDALARLEELTRVVLGVREIGGAALELPLTGSGQGIDCLGSDDDFCLGVGRAE